MSNFVSRAQWGAQPPNSPGKPFRWGDVQGLAVHHTYGPSPSDHKYCAREMRSIQAYYLNHPKEQYSDIAYSWVVCAHGYIFEGRGWDTTTGANGTGEANQAYPSVCYMGRFPEPTVPRTEAFHLVRNSLLKHNSKAVDVQPHSAFVPTACPGDPLRKWIDEKGYEDVPQFTDKEADWLRNFIKQSADAGLQWPAGVVNKLVKASNHADEPHTSPDHTHAGGGAHSHTGTVNVTLK